MEWQTSTMLTDLWVNNNRTADDAISWQPLYASNLFWSHQDSMLLALFLLGTYIVCTLNGRQRNSKTRRLHLSCWPG